VAGTLKVFSFEHTAFVDSEQFLRHRHTGGLHPCLDHQKLKVTIPCLPHISSALWRQYPNSIHLYNYSVNLSLRFNGHFPGEPGLAGVHWSKGWWRQWWQLEL